MARDDRRRGFFGLLVTAAVAAAAGGGKSLSAAGDEGASEGKSGTGAPPPPGARAFSLATIEAERAATSQAWREFLRVESLSMGVYSLNKGAEDKQTPHQQDEVYYVTKGRAVLEVEGKGFPVEVGSVVFVPARARHRFRDITEDMATLVFFAPAETE